MEKISENIAAIADAITSDYDKGRPIDKMDMFSQPDSKAIVNLIEKLLRIVFPGYYVDRDHKIYNIKTTIAAVTEDVAYNLNKQIALALRYDSAFANAHQETIAEYLDTDIEALFEGDPAAESKEAIIICYPGLYAIAVQRFAHVLYQLNVPMIPRIMTEHAHGITGIDINPGATIGKYFFIDHGTGIVVGETTEIGEHVKLYQGVTLGALSTRAGRGLMDKKRHPTIEDNVTIYSGASILGGDTVIGHDSVIGGNVFLTKSIPANTKVNVQNQELRFDGGKVTEVSTMEDDNAWFYVI